MNIQEVLAYLRDNPKGYWFKRKLYGWGWVPVTRQGWLVLAIYIAVIVALSFQISPKPTFIEVLLLILAFELATFALIAVAYKKGEKPKWQWGLKNNKTK